MKKLLKMKVSLASILLLIFGASGLNQNCLAARTQHVPNCEIFAAAKKLVESRSQLNDLIKLLRKHGFKKASPGIPKGGMFSFTQRARLAWGPEASKSNIHDWVLRGSGAGDYQPGSTPKGYSVYSGVVSDEPQIGEPNPTFVFFLSRFVLVVDTTEWRYYVLNREKGP